MRRISAIIAGSIIVFFWSFLSWSLLDWHKPKSFENEERLRAEISTYAPKHGIYVLPSPVEGKPNIDKIEQGPIVYAIIRPEARTNFSMPRNMIATFAMGLMGSIALAAMMQLGARSFMARVMMSVFAGFFVGVLTTMPQLIWWEMPMADVRAYFLDGLISWVLAGTAMAFILTFGTNKKPKKKEA